jgi:RNA polymerase sigma factor (sigma-70 family)
MGAPLISAAPEPEYDGPGYRGPEYGSTATETRRWELLIAHRERLQRLVRSRVRNHQDVEDCVQEALLRAATFHGLDETRIGPFLTTVTLRLCMDVYRRSDQQRRLVQRALPASVVPDPGETVCDESEGAWVYTQIRRLRGRERQVMLARASGASTREAARQLGISTKAAEGAFTRARARMRRWCEDALAD